MILDESAEGRSIRGYDELFISGSNELRLGGSQVALREVAVHFITIVIRVVCVAVLIYPNCQGDE